jgi:hypothetical protein
VDDRRCTVPAEVQEEDRLRLLLHHSTLSPYYQNANFWMAPPLAYNHLCSSPRCLTQFIVPVGRWLEEGVFVGERELKWLARRCGRISRCGRPYDLHCPGLSVCDLVSEVDRRQLWVGLLWRGGAAGSLSAAGPGPSCHTLWRMLFCVDEVLAVAQNRLITGLWVHGSKWG